MPTEQPTELSRIRLKNWTRQNRKETSCLSLLNEGSEPRVSGTESPADWMPAEKLTELSRIKLKTYIRAGGRTNRLTVRIQTDRQDRRTDRHTQADRRTDRHTDRQTHIHTDQTRPDRQTNREEFITFAVRQCFVLFIFHITRTICFQHAQKARGILHLTIDQYLTSTSVFLRPGMGAYHSIFVSHAIMTYNLVQMWVLVNGGEHLIAIVIWMDYSLRRPYKSRCILIVSVPLFIPVITIH